LPWVSRLTAAGRLAGTWTIKKSGRIELAETVALQAGCYYLSVANQQSRVSVRLIRF